MTTSEQRAATRLAVVTALADLGATDEYPGYVRLPLAKGWSLAVGAANANWGADVTDPDGRAVWGQVVPGPLAADATDVPAIVAGIRSLLALRIGRAS